MAPVIDAFTLYPPPPATMSTPLASPANPLNSFVHITLGRYSTSIDLLVHAAPPIHASTDLKARCFDYLADTLIEHSSLYSSVELIGAFKHIPGSLYNANFEVTAAICARIKSAVFNILSMSLLLKTEIVDWESSKIHVGSMVVGVACAIMTAYCTREAPVVTVPLLGLAVGVD